MPTIMGNLKELFRSRRMKAGQAAMKHSEADSEFRFKYALFKELLSANSEFFNLLSDLEEKLRGHHVFGASYVRSQAIRSLTQVFKMVKSLNQLSADKYRQLYDVLEGINRELTELIRDPPGSEPESVVMPYSDIFKEHADWVGGKNANIGEIKNRLDLPVPGGFAVTTRACSLFLDQNRLRQEIRERKNIMDAGDVQNVSLLNRLSREITRLIESSPVPQVIIEEIQRACEPLKGAKNSKDLRFAVRSSAVGEDGEASFAGQYASRLNVSLDQMGDAYKSVIASLFSGRSMSYRMARGIKDDDLSMAVACMEMVDAVAGGVMYTRHPYDITNETLIINAVWGLGPYAVDGVVDPDTYEVEKTSPHRILTRRVPAKKVQLTCAVQTGGHGNESSADSQKPDHGIREIPVPLEKQGAPCLDDDRIRQLAAYGIKLEAHYRCAQDVEWALDPSGRIFILQSRPLKVNAVKDQRAGAPERNLKPRPAAGHRVIIEQSEVACQGIGTGRAYHVRSEADLAGFPKGAVLIAHHSSPEYVVVMGQCSGIVTESGSISGHMAALAREFNVPTLMGLDAGNALTLIPGDMEITLDGYAGRVYEGRVKELAAASVNQGAHMKGTPVYGLLEQTARLMVPLNLINPKSPEFKPSGCRTLHDMARFCHELSYTEMFGLSDMASRQHQCSLRLDAPLPIDLHIIDLGSGLKAGEPAPACGGTVTMDHIQSIPFLALLRGMLNPEVNSAEPRPVNFSGLFSVIREQMLSPGHLDGRFGDRSYAVIADKYVNFSSRVGYHYSVVDAYCGDTINKNYITFSFKGGAADDIKKNRRAKAIAMILEALNFTVDVKEDKVDARLQKYPGPVIQERLDLLGRLLLFSRQMDMLMTTEQSLQWVAQNFLAGNYRLKTGRPPD